MILDFSSFGKKLLTAALTVGLMCLSTACDEFEAHPYDVRITGQTKINARNAAIIERETLGRDTLRFALISDTQGWFDETTDEVADINRRNVDFVIHGGDVSDFGLTREFLMQRDVLNRLEAPYVVIIGNHDHLGNGEDVFHIVFGPGNFSFIAGRVKFVCLETNTMELEHADAVPDFAFMRREAQTDTALWDRSVVCMHAGPKSEQFDPNLVDAFQNYYLRLFRGLMFCTQGHDHYITQEDLFGDGIMYYGSDCAKHRNYFLFTITPDGYSYEIIYY